MVSWLHAPGVLWRKRRSDFVRASILHFMTIKSDAATASEKRMPPRGSGFLLFQLRTALLRNCVLCRESCAIHLLFWQLHCVCLT